jgi:hypothetical protein
VPEQDRRKQHARRARVTIEELDAMLVETRRLRSLLDARAQPLSENTRLKSRRKKKR